MSHVPIENMNHFYRLIFQATLWLCEDYPLAIQEQIMPVVDLMAIFSPIFAKLKSFIQMQLPAGFPVKIGKNDVSFQCEEVSNFLCSKC